MRIAEAPHSALRVRTDRVRFQSDPHTVNSLIGLDEAHCTNDKVASTSSYADARPQQLVALFGCI